MDTPDAAEVMSLAAEVAALLPRRHNADWTVSPVSAAARPAARLSDGPRHFLLATDNGHTTLTTGTPHTADVSLTVAGTAPAVVASAALRSLLPRIDGGVDSPTAKQPHRLAYLAEVDTRLRELGTPTEQFDRADNTTGLAWRFDDASVSFTLHGACVTGAVSFAGGLESLERFLAPFLPPHPGPGRVRATVQRGCGGVARRIVAAYPHAVEADADGLARFADADGGPLQGWVMPRDVNGPVGPRTPVTAGVIGAGVDLVLSALPTIT
ncbi:hypothetical protein ACFFSH_31110 [Streptomyces filamentosus]|uniref:Uncharacterized protein n=1 Tax=Streptomyces filamentosus TaxID=67294 RepID=A0A919EPX1_STRFL|nr:hypothetical protein [Streptomyces filamentosus]GHG13825.1 hypothetical protein GCM10017667_54870 [Streptomyces filamentosus]